MDTDKAFAVIRRALEAFDAEVGKASAGQALTQETLAAVEYELAELKRLVAENALAAAAAPPPPALLLPQEPPPAIAVSGTGTEALPPAVGRAA